MEKECCRDMWCILDISGCLVYEDFYLAGGFTFYEFIDEYST
jgi:hypothetical protein